MSSLLDFDRRHPGGKAVWEYPIQPADIMKTQVNAEPFSRLTFARSKQDVALRIAAPAVRLIHRGLDLAAWAPGRHPPIERPPIGCPRQPGGRRWRRSSQTFQCIVQTSQRAPGHGGLTLGRSGSLYSSMDCPGGAAVRRIAHTAGQNATRRARTPASPLRYRTTHSSSGCAQRTTGAHLTHGDAPRRREHARRPSRRRPRPGLTTQDPIRARRLHRHDSD